MIGIPHTEKLLRKVALAASMVFASLTTLSPVNASPPDSTQPILNSNLAELSLEELVGIEVFKSANLLPEDPREAPATVYSFDQNDFRRFGVRRLNDLLQLVPGFQINQYRKRHRSIWARGGVNRYNDKLVLLVDGIRRQQLYYGHFSADDSLPLENVDKVEIILGPASSLYGANAFSGLISITTKGFTDQPETSVTVESGNFSRLKSSAQYSNPWLQLFGSYLDQQAPYDSGRLSFIGGEVLQPLDEQYKNASVKARPIPGMTLMADYQEASTPFLFIPSSQNAFIHSEAWNVALDYKTGSLDTGRMELNLYYQDDQTREYELEQVTKVLGYEELQNATMAGATVTGLREFGNHTLALGTVWRMESADKMRYYRSFRFDSGFLDEPISGELLADPGISNHDYAALLQDVWQWSDQLKFTLGLRYDKFDKFENHLNYRGAAVYKVGHSHTWKLLYGTAIRQPTLREYLKVLEATDFQSPPLDAERIRSLELNYQFLQGNWDFSVTFYRNVLRDFIREVPTPDNADEYYTNVEGKVVSTGADSVLYYVISDRMNVRFSLAYVDVQEESMNNYDMLYLAPWSGSVHFNYAINAQHQLGATAVFNDDRSDDNAYDDDNADNFTLLNLHLSGALQPSLSYQIGIENVLDEHYMDPAADFGSYHNVEKSRRQYWLKLIWTPDL